MKKYRKFFDNNKINNDRADLGVATLIIFMAMILIAALAASIILYSGGALQEKAINRSDFVIQDSCEESRLEDFVTDFRTVSANTTNATNATNISSLCNYTRYNFTID
ncbi:MAG: hypothetical protein IBX39_05645 [Candidatus Methanoperedenaceae archaeon]|nr:hypothetical protein [Candidatus Methanoperedenaceae archaeon]MDW7725567.1 hypothetical protein [Candidatus Methanoperedens sp.]